LAAGIVPVELHTPCIDLSSLLLEINFNDLREISVVPCLLKSSPNLERLRMIVSTRLLWLDFAFLSDLWLHLYLHILLWFLCEVTKL
jgi:hypothetical protein